MTMNTLKNNRGFSLVEILMAMTIFGIAMMGLAGMSGIAIKTNMSSSRITAATTLAQDRIEYVKGLDFSSIDAAAATENYGTITQHKLFKRVTSVTADPSNPNTKTVTVIVYWRSNKSSISMQTMITKAGI
jgi:type IV pilus assembly protein PilV